MEQEITLIRHGITEGNIMKWYYGASDIPLDFTGIDDITELAGSGIYPDGKDAEFYTSGLIRTEQTLYLIYGEVDHQSIEDLKEMNFGVFEKKSYEDLKDIPYYRKWINDKSGMVVPKGGESVAMFRKRTMAGWEELSGYLDRRAVAVIHGGVISSIMNRCFEKGELDFYKWIPDPGHGFTIYMEDGEAADYAEI